MAVSRNIDTYLQGQVRTIHAHGGQSLDDTDHQDLLALVLISDTWGGVGGPDDTVHFTKAQFGQLLQAACELWPDLIEIDVKLDVTVAA